MEIAKWIDKYIDLQGSYFMRSKIQYHWRDISDKQVKEVVLEDNLLDKIDFGVVLIFVNRKLLFTGGGFVLHNGFSLCESVSAVLEDQDVSGLQYMVFICDSKVICFWSKDLGNLVELVEDLGGECIVVEKTVWKKYGKRMMPYEDTLSPILKCRYSEEERYNIFYDYLAADCSGYRTKDSDFLFKRAFYFLGAKNKPPEDESVVHYFERTSSGIVCGYLTVEYFAQADRECSRHLYDFWFCELHDISGCESGVAHLYCYNGQRMNTFYFVLFCSYRESVLSGLGLLKKHHAITIMDYAGSASCFVREYMHYEGNSAYFNTYFIGIFNASNLLLYAEVFYRMDKVLTNDMMSCEFAVTEEDDDTIEEKYHLRFAYYLYGLRLVNTVPDLYWFGHILSWCSTPRWRVALWCRRDCVLENY